MVSNCAKWLEVVCATLDIERRAPSAERRAPSAERMTAPRAREQADPPSPPDRQPPRRGGRSSPCIYAVSAAGRSAGLGGARRGFLHSARALAAVALLALFGALALPATAQAQSVTTFVSNTGETPGSSSTSIQAQTFTTGSNTGGYTLSEVDVRHISSISTSGTMVKVMSDNGSGRPGALVANLDNPSSFPDDSIIGFTAPASTETLAANTVYWVVVNDGRAFGVSTRTSIGRTNSSDETATAADPNWSIGDTRYWKNRAVDNWSTSSAPLVFAIKGTAVGGTLSSDATLSALTVTAGGTDLVTFASGTTDYAASVANDVAEVTVTAMTTDSGATIEYLDASDMTLTDAGTDAGHQVAVAGSETVIKVKVTAEDGNATQTYMVTVTRAAATCTAPDLTGQQQIWTATLTVGTSATGWGFNSTSSPPIGALSDTGFDVDLTGATNSYTFTRIEIVVPGFAGTEQFLILLDSSLAAADLAGLTMHVCDSDFTLSTAAHNATLNSYSWRVPGADWSTYATRTLYLSVPAASSDATLSDLVVNDGTTDLTLTPTFESGMYTYTASVVSTVAEVTVTPTKSDTGATIEYLDASNMTLDDADTGVTGHQVAVAEGETVIKVKVTAEDGNATQTYMVTVDRAAAMDGRPLVRRDDPDLNPYTTLNQRPPASHLWCECRHRGLVVDELAAAARRWPTDATLSGLAVNDGNALESGILGGEHRRRHADVRRRRDDRVSGRVQYDARPQRPASRWRWIIKVKVTAEDGNATQTYTVVTVSPTCRRHLVRGRHGGGDRGQSGSACRNSKATCPTPGTTIDGTSTGAAGSSNAGDLAFSLTSDLTGKAGSHVGAEFAFSDAGPMAGRQCRRWLGTSISTAERADGSTAPTTSTPRTPSPINHGDDRNAVLHIDAQPAHGGRHQVSGGANVVKVKVTRLHRDRAPTCRRITAAGEVRHDGGRRPNHPGLCIRHRQRVLD